MKDRRDIVSNWTQERKSGHKQNYAARVKVYAKSLKAKIWPLLLQFLLSRLIIVSEWQYYLFEKVTPQVQRTAEFFPRF